MKHEKENVSVFILTMSNARSKWSNNGVAQEKRKKGKQKLGSIYS
jgi:hypothetical protein